MSKLTPQTHLDMIETGIVKNVHSNAQRLKNRVLKHLLKHRDCLGYPKGTQTLPFLVCSNDLCTITFQFIELIVRKAKDNDLSDIVDDIPGILTLLIRSYGEKTQDCDRGCCSFWHSMSKEHVVEIQQNIKNLLSNI
jgi:hypothetical protein